MRQAIRCLALALGALPLLTREAAADRYAVLVGIHDYLPAGPGGPDLPGVENDLRLMTETLIRCYGFSEDPSHMVSLGGVMATGSAIINAIESVGRRVGANDVFVFFYSGHGTYLPDDNRDEADHYDEAICPADIRTGGGPIRDDKLGQLLKSISGHKVVILDSCFSGTCTRDLTFRTEGKSITLEGMESLDRSFESDIPFKGIVKRRHGDSNGGDLDHVLIAGCQDNQTSNVMTLDYPPNVPARQKYRMSALAYFLCLGLRGPADRDGDGRITYQDVASFAREQVSRRFPKAAEWDGVESKRRTARGQTVQIEGRDLNRPVFGQDRYTPLEPHLQRQSGDLIIDVGAAHGFEPGTTLRAGRIKEGVEVKISRLGLFESGVSIISGGESNVPNTTPVTVATTPAPQATARLVVRIAISSNEGNLRQIAESVARRLQKEPFLRIVDKDDEATDLVVRLHQASEGIRFSLAYPGDRIDTGGSAANTEQLTEAIRRVLAQAYAIRRMTELTNPHASFGVRIASNRSNGEPVFRVGEGMQLTVSTNAKDGCYVTLIDIGTSGKLSILYPPPGKEPVRLASGQTLTLPPRGRFEIKPPVGLDRIKVIATLQPLSLASMVQIQGKECPDAADAILRSLGSAASSPGWKGVGDPVMAADQWAESSISIEIRP